MSGHGIEAHDITVRLSGATLVDGAGLTAEAGRLVGLIGPNGAGKTTLLRALLGLVPMAGGRVVLAGRDMTDMPAHRRARHLGYLPQGGVIHWPITVDRLVTLGRLPHQEPWRSPSTADRRAVADALVATDVAHLRHRVATTLSGGERTRALLARGLATGAPSVLVDEPIAGLDPEHQLAVMALLAGLAEQGRTVLAVLHDLGLAARFCHQLVLLDKGGVVASGPPAEVLTPDNLARVYRIRLVGDLFAGTFAAAEP